jgi:hypothetical protein
MEAFAMNPRQPGISFSEKAAADGLKNMHSSCS